jgi:trans-aconitate methyltransferase
MTNAYCLQIDEEFHEICQSTAAGANSQDKTVNKQLIEQAYTKVQVRPHNLDTRSQIICWEKFQKNSDYTESISAFIKEVIPHDFYEESYFDISHSEDKITHYINKVASLFSNNKIDLQKQRWLTHTVNVFSWYFQRDLAATKILSLGCGDGYELFFLRHKYPDATIIAVDWSNKVPEKILEKLDVTFFEANIYDFLDTHKAEYDLIYSSHVLEHSYKIDVLLGLLNNALVQGGILASSIPLCGFENTRYSSFLESVLEGKSPLRQMDCTMLDLGHPWKTNQYDLLSSLSKAQFNDIKIWGNQLSCVRGRNVSVTRWNKEANLMFLMHSILLTPLKNVVYLFMKDPLPYPLVNFNFRLDWKFEFGGGRIANFVPEVFFTAYKS